MAFTNSPLVTYTNLTKNKTTGRKGKNIDTITIHCFVGQVTAKRGCDYFAETDRQCSSNYVVGKDGDIGLSVEEKNRAWTTGGSYTVNGETGSMNDYHAVTIEVACEPKHPYEVTPAAYNALIKLVADIAKRNGMGKLIWKDDKSLVGKPEQQNMTIHAWFANKSCPGKYLHDRLGDIATKANAINYADAGNGTYEETEPLQPSHNFKAGDLVKIIGTQYYNGKTIPNWVKKQNWYIKSVAGNRVVIDENEKKTNAICSPVEAKDLALVNPPKQEEPKPVEPKPEVKPEPTLKVGDLVSIKPEATYYSGKAIPQWVKNQKWYIHSIGGDRVVIDKNEAGTNAICSPVNARYLTLSTPTNTNTQPEQKPAQKPTESTTETVLKVGDKVKLKAGATVYGKTTKYQSWVYNSTLYVREIKGDRVVISTVATGPITGPVKKSDLIKV